MQFHCGEVTRAFGFAILFASGVAVCAEATDDWIARAKEILEQSVSQPAPEWLRHEPTEEELTAARSVVSDGPAGQLAQPAGQGASGRVLIFGSLSLPAPTLKALLEEATHPEVIFVLRGVPRGWTIPQTLSRLRSVIGKTDAPPTVVIDPTLFRRYGVAAVPTLALEQSAPKAPITVEGAVTVEWLMRTAGSVAPGQEHLGHRAETYSIGEPDLVLEIQRRMAGVDWDSLGKEAIDQYWKRHADFVAVEDAKERRQYFVDPSVQVTQDLTDAEGHLLVRAGELFNPLDWVPLPKPIIVFRGTDSRQIAAANRTLGDLRAKGGEAILLTVDVDTDRGWSHFDEMERVLKGAVYVLPAELAQRLQLQHVPALIASEGRHLVVTEMPPGDLP